MSRLARATVCGEDLAAPDLVDVETVSVLRKRWLAKDLTARRFRAAVDDLGDLAIVRYPALPLMGRAYERRANVTPCDAAPGPRCEVRLLTMAARP